MAIVNAAQIALYEDIPKDLLEHVEDILFNRRPDATERMVAFAETVRGEARKKEIDLSWREGTVAGAPGPRARPRDRRVHRGGHRGGPRRLRAAARGDRGAAHGRDADRRRPVRRREDVPATGREERTRDEEGRRPPRAVHGGGEAPARSRRQSRAGQARALHGEGRRARHRQEHRRRRARLQQLRGDRPRRDGAARRPARHRGPGGLRHRRLLRPHHALAQERWRASPARWNAGGSTSPC